MLVAVCTESVENNEIVISRYFNFNLEKLEALRGSGRLKSLRDNLNQLGLKWPGLVIFATLLHGIFTAEPISASFNKLFCAALALPTPEFLFYDSQF